LIGIDDRNVRFDADGRGQIEIPYEKILKANIEYEF
jgi:ribosome maturation factor RimP